VADTTPKTNHEILLPSVNEDQLIHFKVVSSASGYETQESPDRTFQSLPVAKPEIQNGSFEGTGLPGRTQIWPWRIFNLTDLNAFYQPAQPFPHGNAPIDGLQTGHPYGGPSWYGVTCEPDGGNSFIGAASNYGTPKNGGVWQRIETTPGQLYGITMRIYNYQVGGDPEDTATWIGIDPYGGIDPYSPTVQWSIGRSPNAWGSAANSFVAQGRTATIFCLLQNWYSLQWHVNVLDKVGFASIVSDLPSAKTSAVGSPVNIANAIVTATFLTDGAEQPVQSTFAIESPDRSSGIRIVSTAGVEPGDKVTIQGVTADVSGERVINATSVTVNSSGNDIPAAVIV
ncbi:MAG: hypothetical protein K6U00_15315, partial [Armatimonadetes bacterium]|nr:hypothetical protein [Armatimonadota bacterium]